MKKILVANRGEIALRIMKTIKKMGIKSVAVYSEPDRNAPHVRFADEAVLIGPALSKNSYLRGDKIIDVAKKLHVDGIHPGYGFLSENASFAEAVIAAGMRFIGPSSSSIQVMGSKLAAKEAVKKYNIPMVPGLDKAIDDIAKAKKIADEIGYPILIKASAGGGGKGMRTVSKPDEFEEQMERAVSEAQSAFGDGSVFIEKYVSSPRHIEIQVLADSYGNTVHLFERECSIQRRHQKVVEEAPSSFLDDILRHKMGEAAVMVAKSCNYEGAGTVEFLMDENRNFYFLEMNTRLQVEHPVTEMITGIDLVEQQIRVARGEKLAFTQSDITISGHAVELRVYAEDPMNNFLPSVGTLEKYKTPKGPHIRVDGGFEEKMEIPIYYDPMISKLICYGSDRSEAILRLSQAIKEYEIEGIQTTLSFGSFVCEHEAFKTGDFDTHFINKYFSPGLLEEHLSKNHKIAAIAAVKILAEAGSKMRLPNMKPSNWPSRLHE